MINDKILRDCTGCGCCELVCPTKSIKLVPNSEGFLFPKIESTKCVHCNLCLERCPNNKKNNSNNILKKYIIKANNDARIVNSSSGGISDCLAMKFNESNGMVCGAIYDEKMKVKHLVISDLDDISRIQSSKYVQSNTVDAYKKIKEELANNKKVLFIGTPCQVAGLYNYLNGKNDNLFTIDLICHGVPSPLLFEKYIKSLEKKYYDRVINVNFRDKSIDGWNNKYKISVEFTNKKIVRDYEKDRYCNDFISANNYRECCYNCIYSNISRIGDITIGDCWGISQEDDMYDKKGVSLLLVNTIKGLELFKLIENDTKYKEIFDDNLLKYQHNLYNPTKRPNKRNSIYLKIDDNYYSKKVPINLKKYIPESIKYFIRKIFKR